MQLKFISLLWVFAFALPPGCHAQATDMKKIVKNGMTVTWEFEGDSLKISMNAPTDGWVAIGLNERDGLEGTNLIMAAVIGNQVRLSDRYIVAPGDHREVAALGGQAATVLVSGAEKNGETNISFLIPAVANDRFHVHLSPGKHLHLLMAFSLEDDFTHHSVMRTSVEISL
jgi:DOMON domain